MATRIIKPLKISQTMELRVALPKRWYKSYERLYRIPAKSNSLIERKTL